MFEKGFIKGLGAHIMCTDYLLPALFEKQMYWNMFTFKQINKRVMVVVVVVLVVIWWLD